jgi:hypothetical protein
VRRFSAATVNGAIAAPVSDPAITSMGSGVKLDWAIWAGLGMLVVGLLVTAGTVLLMLRIGRRARRGAPRLSIALPALEVPVAA